MMRSMAGRWSDEHIAASLNRMGMPTGQGKTWTAHRVASVRRVRAIHAYKSADKDGEWMTMTEAAATLGVTNHRIRHLIKTKVFSAEQVVPGAPVPNPGQRPGFCDGPSRDSPKGAPVSHRRRGDASNVYRYLKKECAMT